MRRRRLLSLLAVPLAALAMAACGDDGGPEVPGPTPPDAFIPNVPEQQPDDDNRFSRATSVGEGIDGEPEIAPAVRRAAQRAGCEVRAFRSGGRNHLPPSSEFTYITNPPTSGDHYEIWADWGIYDQPVPYPVQVHNLEHGAVILHVGRQVPARLRERIGQFWAASPAFVMVMPDDSPSFPQRAVVVTSWQRWMVCKPFDADDLEAIEVFRDTYRGTGPEQGVNALDPGVENDFPGMPKPLVKDIGSIRGGG